jgi:hypothetical protein
MNMLKRGDVLLILLLAAGLAAFAIPRFMDGAAGKTAVIEVDGEPYMTVDLSDEGREIEIRTDRGYNLLRVRDGGIEMVEADCPDQLCIGFGHVHRPRETITCLPHRLFVEIIGDAGEEAELDAVVN